MCYGGGKEWRTRKPGNRLSAHTHPFVSCALLDRHGPSSVGVRDYPPGSWFERYVAKPSIATRELEVRRSSFSSTMRFEAGLQVAVLCKHSVVSLEDCDDPLASVAIIGPNECQSPSHNQRLVVIACEIVCQGRILGRMACSQSLTPWGRWLCPYAAPW